LADMLSYCALHLPPPPTVTAKVAGTLVFFVFFLKTMIERRKWG